MLDAVLATDPVEEHLDGRLGESPGEDFPLSVSTCSGTPYVCRAATEPVADLLGSLPGISLAETQYLEWSSTPVSALAVVPSAKQKATHQVQLPELHRRASLPALPGFPAPLRLTGSMTAARTRQR